MEYNKERFKKVFFEFNGEFSYDFCLDIINWNHMDRPAPIIEQVRVPGANKDIFYSEGTYENKIIDIECYVDIRHDLKRKSSHIKRIKQWLNADYNYRELRFSDDEGYYEAVCISNMLFEEVVEGLYKTIISFSCNPYKLKVSKTYTAKPGEKIKGINEGTVSAPLRIKVKFPAGGPVPLFSILVYKAIKTPDMSGPTSFKAFEYSKLPSSVREVNILSDEMKIMAWEATPTPELNNFTHIAKSYEFPYAPVGYFEIGIQLHEACEEQYRPSLEATFVEMEI